VPAGGPLTRSMLVRIKHTQTPASLLTTGLAKAISGVVEHRRELVELSSTGHHHNVAVIVTQHLTVAAIDGQHGLSWGSITGRFRPVAEAIGGSRPGRLTEQRLPNG
jgi:hypothetical protein